nr:NAD(+) synthase [Lachnospiraceae bacterium]
MKDGFVSVAAITPHVTVAGIKENTEEIKSWMELANEEKVDVCVFPELCVTGFTCGDLFYSDLILRQSKEALLELAAFTKNLNGLYFVGLPFSHKGKIYNVAAALNKGDILGLVPKTNLPNYGEFYEARQFTAGKEDMDYVDEELGQENAVCLGTKQLFCCSELENLVIGAEICEDLWVPNPPSVEMALNGASLIVNLSASDELTGKRAYRKQLVSHQSAALYCGYVYASAGIGESTQDVVYSGHSLICENGSCLMESESFEEGMIVSEIDVNTIAHRRRTMNTYLSEEGFSLTESYFSLEQRKTEISRYIDPFPFVPSDETRRSERCEEILDIQSYGLRKRLAHTGCKTAVVGISGGLDSTLALLVTARAFDLLELDHSGIIAVTMPGFGTTDRTYQNALSMIEALHATLKEVDIRPAVLQHFKDIEQDEATHD